jgi:hypothetical protein
MDVSYARLRKVYHIFIPREWSTVTLTGHVHVFVLISHSVLTTKQANVFIDGGGMAKLADFGLAIIMEKTGGAIITKSGPKGTVAWMSPERNNIDGPTLKLAPPMDVYSFGILCRTVHVSSFHITCDSYVTFRCGHVHIRFLA